MSEQNPLKMKLSPESGQYYKVENNQLSGYLNESESPSPLAKEIYTRLLNITPSGLSTITDITPLVNEEKYSLGVYDELASGHSTLGLERDINIFINEFPESGVSMFIAGFRFPGDLNEAAFQEFIRKQISLLSGVTGFHNGAENPSIYTFEFNGAKLTIWGMHSNSPSKETSFEYPLLVIKYHGK